MNGLRKLALSALLAIVGLVATGCTTVPAGYVGIEVNNWGNNRGVQDYPIKTGRVVYNPVTTDVHTFPTFQRTVKWQAAKADGETDQSISFNSGVDRVPVNADVGLSVAAKADRVPHIFVKYRLDLDSIIDGPVRNEVKAELARQAEGYSASDIVAGKQAEFLAKVQTGLTQRLGADFVFDAIGFLSAPRIPQNILNAINDANAAAQYAQKAKYLIEVKEAEGKQRIAEATAEAESIRISADAQAYAQQKISQSTTPLIVELKKIEKWNGQLPTVSGSGGTLVNMGGLK